jgi:hypothetical protein
VTSDEHLLILVRQALDDFETVDLPASCRRAFRIAHLLGQSKDSWFFRMDLRPRGGAAELREAETLALFRDQEMAAARGAHAALLEIWMKERQPTIHEFFTDWEEGMVLVGSIGELQRSQQRLDMEAGREPDLVQRLTLQARSDMDVEVLDRIRARTFAYLCRVETDLSVAVITERIFERHRARVDLLLRDVASEVLERFAAAYRRAAEGDAEARSQALTSCRRILHAVADVVCPPQAEPVLDVDGKKHDLTADKYVNRILHFLSDASIGDTVTSSMHATLDEVGKRLDRLNELGSKGVHNSASVQELEWCVIQTYLIAGEVLQLKDAPTLVTNL